MKWLTDRAVDRLRIAIQLPDLTNTRYRAPHFIGSGGMGTVWLAEDTTLHRKVALKVLHFGDGSTDSGSRLMREAQILAALEHPHIVPIHDTGSLADGSLYYAMKYLEGERLDQWLSTVVSQMERIHVWLRIADAIAFAHSKGIIHRDLKPENIMIGHFKEVLVMDWGLGKILGNRDATDGGGDTRWETTVASMQANSHSTGLGTVLGTPGYMAPEQESDGTVDERTDIYGLAGILVAILAGEPLKSDPPRIHRVLRAICMKAMHPDPAKRYDSVRDLTSDITNHLADLPVRAYHENAMERLIRLIKRHRTAVALVASYLLMRLLLIAFARS
jgi:serine/threonine protein kinase